MPKQVKMTILETCPYCKQAFSMMDELKDKNPDYRTVDIDVIEENREPKRAEGYDYWYVPTFFVGLKKIMEGVPTLEKVEGSAEAIAGGKALKARQSGAGPAA